MADASRPWEQPEDIPSEITVWVLHLKLLDIFGLAQMTIYTIRRSRFWDCLSSADWSQNVVVELDSALNEWLDSIPDYRQFLSSSGKTKNYM